VVVGVDQRAVDVENHGRRHRRRTATRDCRRGKRVAVGNGAEPALPAPLRARAVPSSDLLRQAVEAERTGFDGIGCSDHLQPWWEPGESGHAWVWLGAAGQATERVSLGTAVTPAGPRYHPVLIAQAWATLEEMYPGRVYLGVGSGESLNESPLGAEWPPVGEQIERMEEALETIRALFDGERLSGRGTHFATDGAYLHTRPEGRPPIYVSAFGPRAARVAGRLGDGLWTLGDPESVPEILDAYRGAAEDAGREPGEIVLQAGFSWAGDDDAALEGARVWKGSQPKEFYKEDWHDPKAMYARGEEQVSDEELREALIVSSDPDEHVERIREVERLGATMVALMNNSGADPHAAIETYGRAVLPRLRDV
jgi:coenzyme F420-dependent glucose-6-phosphate dehydrogenase